VAATEMHLLKNLHFSVGAIGTFELTIDFDRFWRQKSSFRFRFFWLLKYVPYIGLTEKVLTVVFVRYKSGLFTNFGILIFVTHSQSVGRKSRSATGFFVLRCRHTWTAHM